MKKTNIFKIAALTAVFAVAGMFANAQTPVPAVKLIDNKGTIKYLQSTNGITTITAAAPDGTGVLHTWKLGGTLTETTIINTDGQIFDLAGLTWESGPASTGGASGYTLIVRDEATGATKKMLATDLIQSGQEIINVSNPATLSYTLLGPVVLPAIEQVYVYRNGAKLVATEDYTITPATGTVTIVGITLYAGDKIEVHYIK